jgi:hypothetical protein
MGSVSGANLVHPVRERWVKIRPASCPALHIKAKGWEVGTIPISRGFRSLSENNAQSFLVANVYQLQRVFGIPLLVLGFLLWARRSSS